MKKTLLLGLVLSTGVASAQMTQANEPANGTTSYHLADSNAATLDNITGAGVTWDYSQLAGYAGEMRDIVVEAPSTTTHASEFTSSTKAITVAGQITTYFNSTATERSSQGFVYNDPTYGDIVITLGTDEEKLANYPFNQGDNFADAYAGNCALTYNGSPMNLTLTGTANIAADGEGTLLMPDGSSLSSVLRYKLIDSSYATVPIFGNVVIVRQQYEYYQYSSSNMPVLVITKISASSPGSTTPITEMGFTLSSAPTSNIVGVDKNELSFGMYPNPAEAVLNINGAFSEAEITLMDRTGRIISTSKTSNGKISVADLETGVYFVKVSAEGKTSTKTFVKK